MKSIKRALALLLTVCVVLGMMAPTAFAAKTGTGTREDPFVCDSVADLPASVDVPAGDYLFFVVPAGGMELTVTDNTTAVNIVGPMYQNLAYTSDGMGVATYTFDVGYVEGDQVLFGLYNQNPGAATPVALSIAAPAPAPVGSEKNPDDANAKFFSGTGTYLLNTTLEAGDEDGYWYTFTAEEAGVLCIENSSSIDYQIVVEVGTTQYLAVDGVYSNPISTYRMAAGETARIHLYAEYANGTIPGGTIYANMFMVDGDASDPVTVKTVGCKAYVASGDSVSYQDSSKEAGYAGKGLVVSGYADAIALTTVTVDGVDYTDEDGDGKIELTLGGSYYARPVITISNGHEWNIGYTLTVVESAKEGFFDNEGHELDYHEAVEPCHMNGMQEYWYCGICDVFYANAEATEITNSKNLTIPADSELTHVEAIQAACHYNGNIEYWYCPDCDAYFADEAATQLTNSKNIITPATGSENMVHFDALEAGCHSNGNSEYWFCPDCEGFWADEACTQVTNSKNVIAPAKGSENVVHFDAVEPGCHSLGNIEYWYCPDCEGFWADEACTQVTNSKSVILPAKGSENVVHFEAIEAACHYNGNIEYWFCPDCEGFFADEACTQVTNSKNVIAPAKGSENVVHFAAVEPGCHFDGNIEYWFCPDCEGFWADEACTQVTNSKSVVLPATGSENMQHVEAAEPNCYENGNIEYWHCPDCEGFWQDEACTQLTNSKNVIVPATAHANAIHFEAVEPGCHYNGNIEYWFCPDCEGFWADEALTMVTNSKSVILPATGSENMVHFDAVEPGCHSLGNIEYWFCPDCEGFWADEACTQVTNSKSVVLPATGSENMQHVEAAEPNCYENGNIEYWHCPDCEGFWQDEACTQLTNSKNVIVPATAHANAIHFEAVEPGCHYNGNIEYWFCPDCEGFWADEALTMVTNSKSVILPATGSENVVHFEAVEPGCHSNGNIEYWFCPDCEGFWADEACTQVTNSKSVILPATGSENMQHVEAVEPNCYQNGNIEYWHCPDCEGFWQDEACTQLTNSKNVIVPATAHANAIHFEAVEPGCHYNGNIEYWFCPDCEGFWQDEACTQVTNSKNVILPAKGSENVVHFDAVEPSCSFIGNIEYWYCPDCEGFWADEALTQVTNSKSVILPATGCQLVYFEAVEPGCHSLGNIEYWFCPACEGFWQDEAQTQLTNSKNVILPATGSENVVHFEAVEPGCHYNGNIEYWYCPDCESYYQDEACTQLTNAKRVILPALGCEDLQHFEAVEPGCHTNGNIEYWFCPECEGFWQDEALTQITNSKNVILPATGCEEVEHFEAVEPGCHSLGNIEHWYCPECKGYFADEACTQLTNALSVILPAKGGENMKHVAAVAPTATKDGNVEYWYCEDCQSYYLDEAGTQLTNAKRVILPATGVEDDTNADTGDSIMLFVVLAAVSAMGLAVITLNKKKYMA